MIDSTEKQNKKDVAVYRSSVYDLLAAVYRKEVTPDFLSRIKDPLFLGVFTDPEVEEIKNFLSGSDEKVIEDLAVEYARLFLGPGKHISPHESLHHQREDGDWGKLWGASTVEVKRFIEATGLGYEPDYTGMPDHISVEFELMAALTQREAKAWSEHDEAAAMKCFEVQQKFLENHLCRWVPSFCEKVSEDAQLPFYRAFAELTQRFMNFEMQEINGDGNTS